MSNVVNALAGWLGLVLLISAALSVLTVDMMMQRSGAAMGEGRRLMRTSRGLAVGLTLLAAVATVVRLLGTN